jgi:hypothetical protein
VPSTDSNLPNDCCGFEKKAILIPGTQHAMSNTKLHQFARFECPQLVNERIPLEAEIVSCHAIHPTYFKSTGTACVKDSAGIKLKQRLI